MNRVSDAKPMLRLLFWESTIRCNLTCAHCRRLEADDAAFKDMSTSQARTLISQLSDIGDSQPMRPVMVFSGGEPLCREDIFELVATAKEAQLHCALATNGTLIDDKIANRIKESGVERCSISLDGATAETHDKLRQLEGAFDKAVAGTRRLREAGVPFQINMTLTKHNAHQLDDLYALAKSLGAVAVHLFMLVPVGCGETLVETDMLTPAEYEEKMLDICRLDERGEIQMKVTCGPHYERVTRQQGLHKARQAHPHAHGSAPGQMRPGHGGSSRGCLAGLGVVFVSHEGEVFPCGYLPVKCGNVLATHLKDIWRQSPDLAKMRDSSKLEGKCGLCGYRNVCGGCRARAFAGTGNYMAEEPFCVYTPPKAGEQQS